MHDALSPLLVARYDFPYRLAGKPFPDKAPVLIASVKEHVRLFAESLGVPTSQIVIGGRSMGGRMCSMAIADKEDPLVVAQARSRSGLLGAELSNSGLSMKSFKVIQGVRPNESAPWTPSGMGLVVDVSA